MRPRVRIDDKETTLTCYRHQCISVRLGSHVVFVVRGHGSIDCGGGGNNSMAAIVRCVEEVGFEQAACMAVSRLDIWTDMCRIDCDF